MKEVRLNGHRVEIFSSIEELPITRFHKYNKCLLIDAGVGSNLSAVDSRIERCVRYIKSDKREDAAKEMENLRQSIYFIMQNLSPEHMAFACLVAEIDGKEYNDISDDGLCKVMEILGGVSAKDIAQSTEAIKKKLDEELTLYYPAIFDDVATKEYYDLLKARSMAMLACILDGDNEMNRQKVDEITDKIITFAKPQRYSGKDGAEVEFDKKFEKMCLIISENTHREAKKMTVFEYYTAYQYIEERLKKQKTAK